MPLRRWHRDDDAETMTLRWWRWDNDAKTMTLQRWCWHGDADTMTRTKMQITTTLTTETLIRTHRWPIGLVRSVSALYLIRLSIDDAMLGQRNISISYARSNTNLILMWVSRPWWISCDWMNFITRKQFGLDVLRLRLILMDSYEREAQWNWAHCYR